MATTIFNDELDEKLAMKKKLIDLLHKLDKLDAQEQGLAAKHDICLEKRDKCYDQICDLRQELETKGWLN